MRIVEKKVDSGPRAIFELDEFLSRRLFAHLSTASEYGPRESPVWFVWEGGAVWIIGGESFPQNLQREPRCAIGIVDFDAASGALHHVGMRGTAAVDPFNPEIARLFPQVPDYHLRFRLLETSHGFPFTEDLEFHLLELPKFTKSAVESSSGMDIWLYFLRHVEKMDTEALPAALQQQPLVLRALEELKMLAQTDVERERYEARRKAQLDYNTGLKVARLEGRIEGRAEGEKIGMIHLCERLLNRPLTPTEQLVSLSLEDLIQLADDLQFQVFKK